MTVCCEKIRGIQSPRMTVYPFCILAEQSKHQWELRGIDIPVERCASCTHCVREKEGQAVVAALETVMPPTNRPKAETQN